MCRSQLACAYLLPWAAHLCTSAQFRKTDCAAIFFACGHFGAMIRGRLNSDSSVISKVEGEGSGSNMNRGGSMSVSLA